MKRKRRRKYAPIIYTLIAALGLIVGCLRISYDLWNGNFEDAERAVSSMQGCVLAMNCNDPTPDPVAVAMDQSEY